MSADLRIINGVHIATLRGALDGARGSKLVTDVRSSVPRGSKVVLDCAGMDRMDVEGLRQLLALKRWADRDDGQLVIAAMPQEGLDVVANNGCDGMFDIKPSVPAALQSLGAEPVAEPDQEPLERYEDEWVSPPPMSPTGYDDNPVAPPAYQDVSEPASNQWGYEPEEPRAIIEDGWAKREPSKPASPAGGMASSDWSSGTDVDQAWERFAQQSPAPGKARSSRDPNAIPFWKKPVFIVTLLLLFLVGGVTAWLLTRQEPMALEVSPMEVEVEEGRGLSNVTIVLHHGDRVEEVDKLPAGLSLDPPVDGESEEKVYGITGFIAVGENSSPTRTVTVSFVGRRGDEVTESPKTLRITILRKKQEVKWNQPFNQPPLTEGEPANGYSVLVFGAASGAGSVTTTGMPDGLYWAESPTEKGVWQLSGTPSTPGTYTLSDVTAISPTGDRTSYPGVPIQLVVAKRPPPPPPPPPPIEIPGQDEKIENVNGLDHKLRDMLMRRIDGMAGNFDEDFSDTEISQLKGAVQRLKAAKLVGRVTFNNGESSISPALAEQVRELLLRDDNRELLERDDCYIVVVGYASTTGSRQTNIILSKKRARALDDIIFQTFDRKKRANLCGDYGPTDIHGGDDGNNRTAEIFAGLIDMSPVERSLAEKFRDRFNR